METFKDRVFNVVKTIPKGKVVSYKQIAIKLGNKNLARAVGNALHKNKTKIIIPCHRVVSEKGRLSSNFAFGGIEEQKHLLKSEGVCIKGDCVVDKLFLFED